MMFLNIFHRILVKQFHFGRFDQVSQGEVTHQTPVCHILIMGNMKALIFETFERKAFSWTLFIQI